MANITLGAADRGRVVEVTTGSRLVLQLPENPSTGYRWELQAIGEALKLETDTFLPTGSPQPGVGGLRAFCFRTLAPGVTTLRLQLRQPWDTAVPAAETYEVTLRVATGATK